MSEEEISLNKANRRLAKGTCYNCTHNVYITLDSLVGCDLFEELVYVYETCDNQKDRE